MFSRSYRCVVHGEALPVDVRGAGYVDARSMTTDLMAPWKALGAL